MRSLAGLVQGLQREVDGLRGRQTVCNRCEEPVGKTYWQSEEWGTLCNGCHSDKYRKVEETEMSVNKRLVVLFLNRYEKLAAARAAFDHEAAARRGMPYEERQRMVAQAEDAKLEAEAIAKAVEIVENAEDF